MIRMVTRTTVIRTITMAEKVQAKVMKAVTPRVETGMLVTVYAVVQTERISKRYSRT